MHGQPPVLLSSEQQTRNRIIWQQCVWWPVVLWKIGRQGSCICTVYYVILHLPVFLNKGKLKPQIGGSKYSDQKCDLYNKCYCRYLTVWLPKKDHTSFIERLLWESMANCVQRSRDSMQGCRLDHFKIVFQVEKVC